METTINLIKGDSIDIDAEYKDSIPVNTYAVKRDTLGAQGYVICAPGLTAFGNGIGRDRGSVYNEIMATHFRVSGEQLISVDIYGNVEKLGEIPGNKQVAMPYSFNTQAIITDGKMFLYSVDDGVVEVTDLDLGDPIDGVWIDGYYLMVDGDYIFHTDIADETSVMPLSYGTAEFMPDKILGVGKTQDNKAIVFSRTHIEYFEDVASENFAFKRIESRSQKIGIVSTHAKCEVGGVFYIVGGETSEAIGVHAISLGVTQKVSTKDIDIILSKYSERDLEDIRIESRKERDNRFLIIHLPNNTLCFNETISGQFGYQYAWTELRTDESFHRAINGVYDSRIASFVYGDRIDETIGLLSYETFSQYGETQECIIDSPFMMIQGFSIDELEFNTIPGRNEINDATLSFSVTTDGTTYSQESWLLYGTRGAYNRRFIALRLGYVSNWIGFRFRTRTSSRMSFSGLRIKYA